MSSDFGHKGTSVLFRANCNKERDNIVPVESNQSRNLNCSVANTRLVCVASQSEMRFMVNHVQAGPCKFRLVSLFLLICGVPNEDQVIMRQEACLVGQFFRSVS